MKLKQDFFVILSAKFVKVISNVKLFLKNCNWHIQISNMQLAILFHKRSAKITNSYFEAFSIFVALIYFVTKLLYFNTFLFCFGSQSIRLNSRLARCHVSFLPLQTDHLPSLPEPSRPWPIVFSLL